MFFNSRNDVFRHLLTRWIGAVGTRLVSAQGAQQAECLEAQKKLQIMDTCIKIHRAWQSRSDMKRAVSEFTHQFNLLMVFAEAEPKMDVPREYMWDLRLQILATRVTT
jgi:hypothetical protein